MRSAGGDFARTVVTQAFTAVRRCWSPAGLLVGGFHPLAGDGDRLAPCRCAGLGNLAHPRASSRCHGRPWRHRAGWRPLRWRCVAGGGLHAVARVLADRADIAGALADRGNAAAGVLGQLCTLSATTANPRPDSPARAASMAAFSASKWVCAAMSPISADIFPPDARRLPVG